MQTSGAERGGDLNRSIRKMPAEELSVDLVPLENSAQGWSEGKNFRSGSRPLPVRAECTVSRDLRSSLASLHAALRNGEALGYGDQLLGSIEEAIKQVTFTRGMLS